MMTSLPETSSFRPSRLLAGVIGVILFASACGSATVETSAGQPPADTATSKTATGDTATAEDADAMADPASETSETSDTATAEDADAMADPASETGETSDTATGEDADAMAEAGMGLELEFEGLEPLGDDAVYEGWVIVDDTPISTGRFNIGPDGSAVAEQGGTHRFTFPAGVDPTAVVISIEPVDDPDPGPAPTKVLGGDVADGVAELTIAHPAALGTDFSDATGTYLLGTPTDGPGNNELSGVWFIDLPLAAGLDLPPLPHGWGYEGWAVIDGQPVTTGRFAQAERADDFDGFSGDQGGPAFPGEDFIVNPPTGLTFPTDLTRATIVISVEPDPDDGPEPFAIKPLVADVPAGIGDHQVQSLGSGPTAPTGRATIG